MKIIVDAMGGDNSPDVMVKTSFRAVKELDTDVVIVGDEAQIKRVMSENSLSSDRVSIVHAPDVVVMKDDPLAVRKKKESSMAVALTLLRDGGGDALVSAGNSGALLVGATLIVRCIKGIKRAALAPVMPVKDGRLIIVDSGANIDCRPEMLCQFAVMGSTYMRNLEGIESPRVGLANNGEEDSKGTPLYVEANGLLREQKGINFIGNVEGKGAVLGECDVLVCDGFAGNMILKTYEGAGKLFGDKIKGMFKKNIITKIGALFVMGGIKELQKSMDYKEIGGAVLLGIQKPVVKAHGSSDEKGFFGAMRQAVNFAKTNVIGEIEQAMAKIEPEPAAKE